MSSIVKISLLAIVGVILALQFRSTKSEYSIYIGTGISIIIFCFCINQVNAVIGQIMTIKSYLNGGEKYLGILLKVVGITYICEFAASICKDGGFSSVAEQIEILGKLSVMLSGMPILFAVIDELHGFMQ